MGILQEVEARLKQGSRGESRERGWDSNRGSHWNLLHILRSRGSKRLWSSQPGINVGVLQVNLRVETVCLDRSLLLFQHLLCFLLILLRHNCVSFCLLLLRVLIISRIIAIFV